TLRAPVPTQAWAACARFRRSAGSLAVRKSQSLGSTAVSLYTNWKRLRVSFRSQRQAGETSLQQRHQPRVPVANHEEDQERNRDVVLVVEGVVNREREIGSNQQLDPRYPPETPTIIAHTNFVLLRLHAILWSSSECSLLSDQSFQHGTRVRDRQTNP